MDDRELAQMFYSRSDGAIKELEAKYGRLCRRIAGNILDDPRDVEECVNDSLLAVWNQFERDRPEQLTAYICKIVRNISLKRRDWTRAAISA